MSYPALTWDRTVLKRRIEVLTVRAAGMALQTVSDRN